MPKKRRTKKRSSSNLINILSYIMIVIALLIAAAGAGYYFGYHDAKNEVSAKYEKEKSVTSKMLEKLQNAASRQTVLTTPELKKQLQKVLKKEVPAVVTKTSAIHEYATDKPDTLPPEGPVRPNRLTAGLPKLAIIIDDVSFARDVKLIKALRLPVTMSFLPPSPNHPDSAKLAAREPFYMVHLPLEAKNFSAKEPSTLYINSSQDEIMRRIGDIKRDFPKVRYINNHTGSTFTANETAVNRLVYALRKENIRFIDSRTTAKTSVPKVMKNFGMPYLARDVFLDHYPEVHEVKKQIKRAVEIAKQHGSAIAIGHPHKKTLQALAESGSILKSVKLVYVNQL